MEMAMEVKDELSAQVERLAAAAGALECAVERLREIDLTAVGLGSTAREAELEERLMTAEATIAELRAAGAGPSTSFGRKTVGAGVASLMAKSGVAMEMTSGAALDAALVSLSIEQRIAVKAGMLRAGLVG